MLKRTQLFIISFFLFFSLNAQWFEQNSGFASLRAIGHICAVDTSIVWAAAYDPLDLSHAVNEYTKTTNGGDSWQAGIITGADSLQVSMIFALDANIAYAALYHTTGDGGKLMKTTDGGTTWSAIDSLEFRSSPKLCYFWNENEGMVVADPDSNYFQIFTTNDGGITWAQVEKANMPVSQTGELTSHKSYTVLGETFWFGGITNGKVYVSYDRGRNWSFIGTPLDDVAKIIFRDSANGIAGDVNLISNSWNLYKTNNRGLSWSQVEPDGIVNYYDICYVPGTPNAYVSSGYSLSQSSDGGKTWISFTPPSGGISPYYTSLNFVNPETGWAGGVNFNNFSGGIYKYHGAPLNIHTISEENAFNIYPNPGKGIFRIDLKDAKGNISISVYNLMGNKVFDVNNYFESIDLSHLCPGIYMVKIIKDNKMLQDKLIIIGQ